MSAPKVRSDYETLSQLASRFGREGERTRQTISNLQSRMGKLQGGDWVGKGANKFYAEMNSAVFPSLKRLAAAMERAQSITGKISQIMKQAEEEAAAVFRADGGTGAGAGAGGAGGAAGAGSGSDGGGTGAGGSGGSGGSSGGGSGGAPGGGTSGGGAGGSSGGSQQNPLMVRDPNSLFTDDYMKGLVDSKFQGADSAALNQAMEDLMRNPKGAELDAVLGRIAQLRGRPLNEIKAEYDKFLKIKAQRDANNSDTPPDLNFAHPNFAGSTSQLRYGKVVGDAFGVDPVFGAMLNPTGGLVGPGNFAVDGDSSAVGYHGVVHDAAGYLYNYHKAGPGYDYLGLEGRDTSSPLSGQREGIAYWRQTLGGPSPVSTPVEYAARGLVGGIDTGSSILSKIGSIF